MNYNTCLGTCVTCIILINSKVIMHESGFMCVSTYIVLAYINM